MTTKEMLLALAFVVALTAILASLCRFDAGGNNSAANDSDFVVGPKEDFRPSINMRTGRLEHTPNFDLGPRKYLD